MAKIIPQNPNRTLPVNEGTLSIFYFQAPGLIPLAFSQ